MEATTTITVRIDTKIKERLGKLAQATSRTKSFLIGEALRSFVEENEWQIDAIKTANEDADKEGAKFADHKDVVEWLESWGTDKKKEPPECK